MECMSVGLHLTLLSANAAPLGVNLWMEDLSVFLTLCANPAFQINKIYLSLKTLKFKV